MTRGKKVCKILKEIRQQIADKNDIEYITSECYFQGECKGTCPKCEAEVRYLENELNKRRQLGKAAVIAGISLGIAGSFTACNKIKQEVMVILGKDTVSHADDIMLGEIVSNDLNTKEHDENIKYDRDSIFVFPEVLPTYPGGDKALRTFIQENLVYPKDAKEEGIRGTVYIQFVIEKDGSISNVNIVRSIDNGGKCDKEAVRIVSMMPKWEPGKMRGEAVRSRYAVPVRFRLE